MFDPSRLLWWGLALLAFSFLISDPWVPLGEVMKLISILLLTGSIYHDVRAWSKRKGYRDRWRR